MTEEGSALPGKRRVASLKSLSSLDEVGVIESNPVGG
jgi:hypothetical protein